MPSALFVNESARTFAWWMTRLQLNTTEPATPVQQAWNEIRDKMRQSKTVVFNDTEWPSDPWLARTAEAPFGSLVGGWGPPDEITKWQTVIIPALDEVTSWNAKRTNHPAFRQLLSVSEVPIVQNNAEAVSRFMHLKEQIGMHADDHMVQWEHTRSWLGTALGRLLMGLILSPDLPYDTLVRETMARLNRSRQPPMAIPAVDEFEEQSINYLFNSRVSTAERMYFTPVQIRAGQSEEWREYWDWLSRPLSAERTAEALHQAASLLRCPAIADGLQLAVLTDDHFCKTVALAVIRRLLLTLKAMTWLEAALQHAWEHTHSRDLACFAFNAVKPEWPRRTLAISHRSGDVKETLIKMELWRSGRCAIDANYVPSWETNTGMMWGLFAATPLLARIHSPQYRSSPWCNREWEILEYLVRENDFMENRWVMDIPAADLPSLDAIAWLWKQNEVSANRNDWSSTEGLGEYPPQTYVWMPRPMPEWEMKMLRATAALRLMLIQISSPAVTNAIAWYLEAGMQLPQSPPTNQPGGWDAYASIFRNLRSVCSFPRANQENQVPDAQEVLASILQVMESGTGAIEQELPIGLPVNYTPEDMSLDLELNWRIPDLSTGKPSFEDILLALEWVRTEWPVMLRYKKGNFVAIDCRNMTRQQWEEDASLSLFRGLAALRLPFPLWFVQLKGQDVEYWPFVGERPIFTQYADNQFSWMWDIFFERREMQALYPKTSGLNFSPGMLDVCATGMPKP